MVFSRVEYSSWITNQMYDLKQLVNVTSKLEKENYLYICVLNPWLQCVVPDPYGLDYSWWGLWTLIRHFTFSFVGFWLELTIEHVHQSFSDNIICQVIIVINENIYSSMVQLHLLEWLIDIVSICRSWNNQWKIIKMC